MTASAISNPVRDGFAVLTPSIFRSIDILARKHAGLPFKILSPIDMEGDWGRSNLMAGDVFRDVRKLATGGAEYFALEELATLDIANEIRVAGFANARRPEIDLSQVPADRIYEFVAWHEIAHRADNFDPFAKGCAALHDAGEWGSAQRKLNEILADRFAWGRVFPGVAIPVRAGCEDVAAWADVWCERFAESGIRRGPLRESSIDAHPLTWVPTAHVRKSIPWSKHAKPELRRAPAWVGQLRRARAADRAHSLRRFGAHARQMVELWSKLAKRPTAEAMRLNRQGIVHTYRDAADKRALVAQLKAEA